MFINSFDIKENRLQHIDINHYHSSSTTPPPWKKFLNPCYWNITQYIKKQHEHVIHLKCKYMYLHNYIVASMIICTLNTWNNKHYISFVYCKFWPFLPKEMPKKLSHKSNTILSRDIFLKACWKDYLRRV